MSKQKEVRTQCEEAFERFISKYEVEPGSSHWIVMKAAFEHGYSEGGQEGAKRVSGLIVESLGDLFNGVDT